ncbi:MAG: aminotransferase class V-fold PLP-dependent enzyme [Phycisphaerales bacterium]
MIKALVQPQPLASDLRSRWLLDESVTFLNHGSFGATPRVVLDHQSQLRAELERQPVEFLDRRGLEMIRAARTRLADFIHARMEDIGFVTNATEGVSAVVRSMTFQPGDEIITTTHRYQAVGNTLAHIASRSGATLTQIAIDLPFDASDFAGAVTRAISSRTRLVVIDHITSTSALILPVQEIASRCRASGVDLLIDGAHAPGMLDLEVPSIGTTYYTGNCHKWMCAPKGAAFLWVDREHQSQIHPSIISNFFGAGFEREFAWQGTRDITPWLCVPVAIDALSDLGWERIRTHNHALAVWAQSLLCDRWGVEPISAADGRDIGSIATIPLPAGVDRFPDVPAAQAALYAHARIEVPFMEVNGRRMVRPSCQVYNTPAEYERLADAVLELFAR